MKNLVQLILAFLFVNAQMLTEAAAQPAVTLVISPNNSNVVCPQNLMTYTVSAGSNSLPTCTYTWTISGGTIHNGNTGTSVDVKWNDETGTGTLTVTTSACSSLAEDGNAKTVKYTRQSVFGQNFASSSCALR